MSDWKKGKGARAMMATIGHRLQQTGQGGSFRVRLVRGGIGVGGLQVLSRLLTLAATVLLARRLGTEGFGHYAFIMALLPVLALPLNQGLRDLVTREVAGYHHGEQWALFRGLLRRTQQWVLIGSAGLILFLGGVVATTRATWQVGDRWTLLMIGLVTIPFLGLVALRGATLRGLGYVVQAQIPDLLVRPAVRFILVLLLLVGGVVNPATALASEFLATAFAFVVAAGLLNSSIPNELDEAVPGYRSGEWGRAWFPFTLLVGVGMLNNQVGILLLGGLGTPDQVAGLRVAERGAQLVAMTLMAVNLVIGPHITRASRDGDHYRMQRLFTQSARSALVVALPVALSLIFFGGQIIALVFGEEYENLAATSLVILATAQLANVAFGSVGMFLKMSGYERDTLFGQVAALSLNLLVALVLIPPYGTVGAALATAIGMMTWNLILAVKVLGTLRLRPGAF